MSEAQEVVEKVAVVEKAEEESKLVPAPMPSQSPWKNGENGESIIPEQAISLEHTTGKKSNNRSKKKSKNKKSNNVIKINSATKWEAIEPVIVVADAVGNGENGTSAKKSNKRRNKKKKATKNDEGLNGKESENGSDEKQNQNQKSISKKKNNQKKSNKKKQSNGKNENASVDNNASEDNNDNKTQSQSQAHHNNRHKKFIGDSHNSNRKHQNSFQQPFYSLQPIIDSINAVANQIEYYLSKENLDNDSYLKAKLSKDGYISMYPLSKFFRLVNLSFGGNVSIILAALREMVINPNATVSVSSGAYLNPNIEEAENILSQYFIRGKDWESYKDDIADNSPDSSFIIEKVLSGNDLDQYVINPQNDHHRKHNVKHEQNVAEENTQPVIAAELAVQEEQPKEEIKEDL